MRSYARAAVVGALLLSALPLAGTALGDPVDATAVAGQPDPAFEQRSPVQRGSVLVLPPISQNGAQAASAAGARTAGQARFTPARPGRPVLVQRRLPGGPWRPVARTTQDAAGVARFTAARPRPAYSYRALAPAWRSLPAVTTAPTDARRWSLRYDEQFPGRLADTDFAVRQQGLRYGSRLRSASDPRAVRVSSGQLRLHVLRDGSGLYEGTRVPFFANGHVGTQGAYDFRYGIAAARVRFPRGRGQHGSFWLQPTAPALPFGPPAQAGAEIDVVEFFGKGAPRGGLAHFLHWYEAEGVLSSAGGVMPGAAAALASKSDAWWKRFHVFSVEWTPTQYVFRIDGIETFRTSRGVSRQRQYLILSLLTSDWELPHLDLRSLPTRMDVDWVRVWQLPGQS